MYNQNYIELEKIHFVKCCAKDCPELVNDDDDTHYFKFCKEHRLQFDSKSISSVIEGNPEKKQRETEKHGRRKNRQ